MKIFNLVFARKNQLDFLIKQKRIVNRKWKNAKTLMSPFQGQDENKLKTSKNDGFAMWMISLFSFSFFAKHKRMPYTLWRKEVVSSLFSFTPWRSKHTTNPPLSKKHWSWCFNLNYSQGLWFKTKVFNIKYNFSMASVSCQIFLSTLVFVIWSKQKYQYSRYAKCFLDKINTDWISNRDKL